MLLLGGRSGLFGLDPLGLRLLLLLVGDLKLIRQLLAQAGDQQLRRQCRVAKLDLLDDDAGPQTFRADRILDGVLEFGPIVGKVEHVPALGADHVAHDRPDRRHHDVVLDFRQPADRGDDKRGIVGGHLGENPELERHEPALDKGRDGRVGRARRHRNILRPLRLR